jgi:hypothetical protein
MKAAHRHSLEISGTCTIDEPSHLTDRLTETVPEGALAGGAQSRKKGARPTFLKTSMKTRHGGGGLGFLNATRVGWTAGGGVEWLFLSQREPQGRISLL